MRGLLILLLLSGCTIHNAPSPSYTALNKDEKNWAKIYLNEIRIAQKNQDIESVLFFWPEYLKELEKSDK